MLFERVHVPLGLQRKGVALVVDVVVVEVPLAGRKVVVGELRFELVELPEERPELPAGSEAATEGAGAGELASATLTSRTAPDLNSGCFETGSQIVIVSSFAARPRPVGSCPLDSSQ